MQVGRFESVIKCESVRAREHRDGWRMADFGQVGDDNVTETDDRMSAFVPCVLVHALQQKQAACVPLFRRCRRDCCSDVEVEQLDLWQCSFCCGHVVTVCQSCNNGNKAHGALVTGLGGARFLRLAPSPNLCSYCGLVTLIPLLHSSSRRHLLLRASRTLLHTAAHCRS